MRTLFGSLVLIFALATPVAAQTSTGGGPAAQAAFHGTVDVLVVDHRNFSGSEMAYFLRDDARGTIFELKFKSAHPAALRSGQRVSVAGRATGRTIAVDSLTVSGTSSTAGSLGDVALAERRAVVLMVDLQDAQASSRYTLAQIAGHMFTNSQSVDSLYRGASFGQIAFPGDTDGNGSGDVFGPFQVSHSAAANCSYYDWANAAEAAAQAAGVDLSRYQHRVFVLPHWQQLPNCSWAGVANVGCGTFCRAWIAEAESPMVYAHELGHNLNMAHAGTDPENDGIVNSAYGDGSDPMGSSRIWRRFAAPHIDQMGWYGAYAESIATITTSGTYLLSAVGANPASSTSPQVLKIAKPDSGDYYYLSYREASGWDSSLASTYTQGVNIHRYRGSGYNPTTFIQSLTDATSFTDSINGITITQVNHGGGSAGVTVSYGGCVGTSPTASVTPASRVVSRGSASAYTYSLRNNDGAGCPTTTFATDYSGVPAGSLSAGSLGLASGQSLSLTLQVDTNVPDGYYPLTVRATDNDGLDPQHAGSVTASATVGVDGTAPTAPSGLTFSTKGKSGLELRWTASTDSMSGLASYTVYRNGAAVGQTTATTWSAGNLQAGTYTFTVVATDQVGLTSGPGSVTVTIAGGKRPR